MCVGRQRLEPLSLRRQASLFHARSRPRLAAPARAEKVLQRGEKIELLVDKTEQLSVSARRFQKQSKELKNVMWCVRVPCGCLGVLLISASVR